VDSTILNLGEDLSGFLATLGQPIEQTAREMIVFELYRRSLISSGKAAEFLGIPRVEFIQRASELGIPTSASPRTSGRRRSRRASGPECRNPPRQRACPLAACSRSRNVFGTDPLPQILKEPKSLYQSPSGTSGFASIQSRRRSDRGCRSPGPAFGLSGAGGRRAAGWPTSRSSASAAKDHSTHLIAQALDFIRIGRAPEAFGEVEELLLFALLGLHAVFDEFYQHPVGTEPARLRQTADLVCDVRRQANALSYRPDRHPHDTIMHQTGAVGVLGGV